MACRQNVPAKMDSHADFAHSEQSSGISLNQIASLLEHQSERSRQPCILFFDRSVPGVSQHDDLAKDWSNFPVLKVRAKFDQIDWLLRRFF